jgi:hypothetical protein
MQDHPIPEAPSDALAATRAHRVQRRVLLELVTTPPADGDDIASLARRLDQPPRELEAAIEALVDAGLARRDDDVVRATTAALRFEALWPICP